MNDGDDNSEGDHPVAVISYAWWKRSLARDPNVLSRTLKLGDTTYNIVGVAPPEFFGTKVGEAPDIWVPLSMVKEVPPNFGGYKDDFSESLLIMGRLKPGVSTDEATANVNLLFRQILVNFAGAKLDQENQQKLDRTKVPLTPMATGLSSLRRQFSEPLKILMGVVALVLLIACANIANLLLARSTCACAGTGCPPGARGPAYTNRPPAPHRKPRAGSLWRRARRRIGVPCQSRALTHGFRRTRPDTSRCLH